MKTDLIITNDTDSDFTRELMDETDSDLLVFVYDSKMKLDNVLFCSRIYEGWFVTNLVTELSDQYVADAIRLVEGAGYSLELAETEKDYFNTLKKVS